ncbi:MAG: MFS transporter [Burkholderiales bacterium]|nr:MFS transporter [Burkholderiales bacterium]
MPTSNNKFTLFIACLITCLAVGSVYLTQSIFPLLAHSYGLPDSAGRLTFTYASIAYAIAFFVFGPWSDLLSPKKLASVGLIGSALALALAASTSQFDYLLIALMAMGAAAAIVPAAMFALVPRLATPQQLGSYFGLLIAASVIGISVGRSVPSLLTGVLGWRNAFLCYAALLALAVAIAQKLPAANSAPSKFPAWSSLPKLYLATLELLTHARLLRLFATGFALFFGYLGCITFLTYRLHQAPFQFDTTQIGGIGFLGLIAILGAPLSGRLMAKTGPRKVALGSLILVLLAIATLTMATSASAIVTGVLLMFLGVFSCQPAIFTMISGNVPATRRGAASSLYLLTWLGAVSAASASLGTVWNQFGFQGIAISSSAAILLAASILLVDKFLIQPQSASTAGLAKP